MNLIAHIYMALKEFKITIVTKCCGTPFDARQLYVRNAKGHKNYANKLFGKGHVRPTSLAMHNSAGSKKYLFTSTKRVDSSVQNLTPQTI